jgi:hypothetical protein
MTSQLMTNDEKGRDDLGSSFVDSVMSEEVIGLAVTLPDAVLSDLTSETVLGNIPIFGAIYNFSKGLLSIADHFF